MADTTVSYTCPNCGGPLDFAPGAQKVVCPYCDTEFETKTIEDLFAKKQEQAIEAEKSKEKTWDTKTAGSAWSEEEAAMMKVVTCSSCGAEIVCDENTMATECCYCGNPTMIPARFDGMLKPDSIIPFKKTKEEAVAALKDFYKGKYLLPSAFTKNNRVEAIQPMYVPFWLFDADVRASAAFRAESDHVINTPDETITETSIYRCERSGTMRFQKIPVDGSTKMDDTYMESIEPFHYADLVPFSSAYFTGCLADKYDVDAKASEPRASARIEESAVGVLESTVTGYTRTHAEDRMVEKEGNNVSYAMVPVWILTTRYKGVPYTFMMNGQTGKIVGSLPYDNAKSFLYMGITSLVLLPIFYFLLRLFM